MRATIGNERCVHSMHSACTPRTMSTTVRWLVLLAMCAPAAVLADPALDSTQLSRVIDAAVTRVNDGGTFKRLRDQHGFVNAVEVATWYVRHSTRIALVAYAVTSLAAARLPRKRHIDPLTQLADVRL